MTVRVGDPAPDFAFQRRDGARTSLREALRERAVVLYFYPKDDTPGCTAEACSFRDSYEAFSDAGAEVIGVSADSDERHQAFAQRHRLPFTLVSDADGALRRAYGVPRSMLGLLPGRVTYVIDRQGTVRHVFNSQLNATKHITEALGVVQQLAAPPSVR